MDDPGFTVVFLAILGLGGGIVLLARGLVAYRRDRLITAVATSSLDGLAAGEVRVTGVVQAIDQQLTSPLQSRPCVWYRARIESTDDSRRVLFDDERAVQFRVADARGAIRVVPGGARWEVGTDFDERTSLTGAEPHGLHRRHGGSYAMVVPDDPQQMSEAQRQAAIVALLTVSPTVPAADEDDRTASGISSFAPGTGSGRRYREARLEVGQTVTVLGQALPWADAREELAAPAGTNVERVMADDLAIARETGQLAATPEEAWGNAAIPGFGIGRPTSPPSIDPAARPPAVAGPEVDAAARQRYQIPAHELVLARATGGELAIYEGAPVEATRRHDADFLLGLVGAVMVVVCTLALGVSVAGGL
jgi:hypothetical protein